MGIPIISRFFQKRDEGYIEMRRQERIAIQSNESQNPGVEEAQEMANRAGYFIHDPICEDIITQNPALRSLWPTMAPTSKLANLTQHEIEMAHIRLDKQIIIATLTMPKHIFNADGYAMLQSFRNKGHIDIASTREGWTARSATQSVKVHEFRDVKEKK